MNSRSANNATSIVHMKTQDYISKDFLLQIVWLKPTHIHLRTAKFKGLYAFPQKCNVNFDNIIWIQKWTLCL